MLVLATLIAGCGTKQAQEAKTATVPQVGIIDISKAVKAHPKYKQLMELGQQADTLAAQLEAQQNAMISKSQIAQSTQSQNEMDELNKSFEQEFNAKISAKEEELNPRLAEKADDIRRSMSHELEAYNDQLEKEYQPQIFNLQLKLKTLQPAKEETASLQVEVEKLQAQRSEALATKQKQLVARMDELMAPEKAAAEQELAAYAKQLNEEISKKIIEKQAQMAARFSNQQLTAAEEQVIGEIKQQLTMKQQELQALQGFILENIKEKTAKVASGDSFEVVVTNIAVNINAVDITSKVVAECNK